MLSTIRATHPQGFCTSTGALYGQARLTRTAAIETGVRVIHHVDTERWIPSSCLDLVVLTVQTWLAAVQIGRVS